MTQKAGGGGDILRVIVTQCVRKSIFDSTLSTAGNYHQQEKFEHKLSSYIGRIKGSEGERVY